MLMVCCLFSQAKAQTINQNRWREITKDISYTENYKEHEEKEVKPTEFDPDLSWWKQFFNFGNFDFASLKVPLYTIIICALAILIYLLLLKTGFIKKGGKKRKPTIITLENFEEHVDEADLNYLLKKALHEKLYFVALRIQYLIVLQSLNEAQYIAWKKDKTNGAYLAEMIGNALYSDFSHLTYVFEKVWYGDIAITAQDYELLSVHYQSFNHKIGKNETK